MANKQRDVEKERTWRRNIQAQRGSGLSVRAFCAREQLSEASFYAWRRTLAERKTARQGKRRHRPPFVNLTARGAASLAASLFQPAAPLELVHSSGHVLRIAPSCDASTLSMVLAALVTAEGEVAGC
jgi:hypothetical protein